MRKHKQIYSTQEGMLWNKMEKQIKSQLGDGMENAIWVKIGECLDRDMFPILSAVYELMKDESSYV